MGASASKVSTGAPSAQGQDAYGDALKQAALTRMEKRVKSMESLKAHVQNQIEESNLEWKMLDGECKVKLRVRQLVQQ